MLIVFKVKQRTFQLSQGIENCVIDWLIFPFDLESTVNIRITKFYGVDIAYICVCRNNKLCRFFVKSILTLTGYFMFFFCSIDYCSVAKSRKPNNDSLTWFFCCLVYIQHTNPVCPIYNCIRDLYTWILAKSHNFF